MLLTWLLILTPCIILVVSVTNITCDKARECASKTLNCSNSTAQQEACSVYCSNYESCKHTMIQCPISHNCSIHCTDHYSCYNATIYCPSEDSCSVNGGDAICSLCGSNIYAVDGFDGVDIRCTDSDCLLSAHEPEANMHCNADYDAECRIDSTLNKCSATSPDQHCSNMLSSDRSLMVCDATNSCNGTTISCTANTDCLIECVSAFACFNATIQCPPHYPCNLHCHGTKSCAHSIINAASSSNLQIINDGSHALSSSSVYCPDNNLYQGPYATHHQRGCVFITNGNFTIEDVAIFALEGFNDVDIGCHLYECHVAGHIHCAYNYSASCSIDTLTANRCMKSNAICNAYAVHTMFYTKAPTPSSSTHASDDSIVSVSLHLGWDDIIYILSAVLFVLLLCGCCCFALLIFKRKKTKTIIRKKGTPGGDTNYATARGIEMVPHPIDKAVNELHSERCESVSETKSCDSELKAALETEDGTHLVVGHNMVAFIADGENSSGDDDILCTPLPTAQLAYGANEHVDSEMDQMLSATVK